MPTVPVIIERHDALDLEQLGAAWSSRATFAFLPEKTPVSADWVGEKLALLPPELREDHFALLTSGSTGRPKLVVGEKARAEALARLLHRVQQSEAARETVVVLPLSYCYAFVNQWLWARCHDRALTLTRGFADPRSLGDTLDAARDAMLCLTGVHVPLLERYFGERAFGGVIRVHFAGGAFPQSSLEIVRRIFPAASIFNNYGCAEAMPRLTVRSADDGDEGRDVGPPIDGVELRTSVAGDVEFRSAYGARAFIDDEGFHAIADGEWVRTGDVGEVMESGRLRLSGRRGEVFKRHGEKIALPLIAETIRGVWPGAVALYRERDAAGEDGYVAVLAPEPASADLQQILQRFRSAYARAAWPLRIESISELPKLPNGKIDLSALPAVPGKHLHWQQRIG